MRFAREEMETVLMLPGLFASSFLSSNKTKFIPTAAKQNPEETKFQDVSKVVSIAHKIRQSAETLCILLCNKVTYDV